LAQSRQPASQPLATGHAPASPPARQPTSLVVLAMLAMPTTSGGELGDVGNVGYPKPIANIANICASAVRPGALKHGTFSCVGNVGYQNAGGLGYSIFTCISIQYITTFL